MSQSLIRPCLLTFLVLWRIYNKLVKVIFFSKIYYILNNCGEGNGNPLQYSCLENPVDREAWWAAVHRVSQSWTRLIRLSMHALEKEMATLSSILAWRIPGTEEPGGLQSTGVTQSWTRLKQLSPHTQQGIYENKVSG